MKPIWGLHSPGKHQHHDLENLNDIPYVTLTPRCLKRTTRESFSVYFWNTWYTLFKVYTLWKMQELLGYKETASSLTFYALTSSIVLLPSMCFQLFKI